MEEETWRKAGRAGAEAEAAACEFIPLHRTDRGRIFHCPAFRRVVIDFAGVCLVLRPGEFHRLRLHLGRIAACGLTRARLAGGERIRLRDATGEKSLILDLDGLGGLVEVMQRGALRLDSGEKPAVAESLGASCPPTPFPEGRQGVTPYSHKIKTESHSKHSRSGAGEESPERPDRPYQSAFINTAIAGRAFPNPSESEPCPP